MSRCRTNIRFPKWKSECIQCHFGQVQLGISFDLSILRYYITSAYHVHYVNKCRRLANKRFSKTSVYRGRSYTWARFIGVKSRSGGEKGMRTGGEEGSLSTTCYLHTLQTLRGTITIARTTMRMQMSQCALIWICVSAISLNNNRRITITRDLRDLTGRGSQVDGGNCRRGPRESCSRRQLVLSLI